jgi:hypothetical protein
LPGEAAVYFLLSLCRLRGSEFDISENSFPDLGRGMQSDLLIQARLGQITVKAESSPL